MLNISENSIGIQLRKKAFKTLEEVENRTSNRVLLRLIGGTFIVLLIIMFVPWTQNIRSYGDITTLHPDQRPQTIHSVIAGRIEKWYVKEGDFVSKGDTIAFISEIKPEYFDPLLVDRTGEQTELKKMTVMSYEEKIEALDNQIRILHEQLDLKLQQGRIKLQQANLKVTNDSISVEAASINYQTSADQFKRIEEMYKDGLKSKTDLENRQVKMQQAYSYLVEAENKLLASRSELIATRIELSNIQMKYDSDIAKALSEKYSAQSNKLTYQGEVSKLENQYSNYELRSSFYYILAPQDCYVTKLIANGIGETIKEGSEVVTIMPTNFQLAAEIYVDPLDLPLLKVGEHVRLQFDGWPAIVFSGWPNASYGTYGGRIYAIDQYISENGKYRILVEQDPNDHPWPEALRYGGGVNAMVLLEDVPIWYELWRKINGFPPNYYKSHTEKPTYSDKKEVVMRSTIVYIMIFLFGLTGFAQDSLNNVLTYEEYMRIVKTHHPVARQANILVESSGAYLNKAQGAFDPTLSGSANQKYFKDQQYYSMLNGQLKIPTWFGVSFHGGYDLNNGIYLNPERNLPDDGLWYAGINVSLGKGLIIDERRAQYKKAKIYQEASIQEQILLLNDLQLNASIAYWEWFKASTKVVIYEEAVDNAQERFENVKQSAILGDKPFIDTLEAYIQLQNRLIKLLDAELEKMNTQSYMEIFLWQDGFVPVEIDSSISCPGLNNISYRTIVPQLALRVDSLKTYHPEILNTQYKIDQKKVDLQLSQNNLLPELNFKYNALTYSDDGNLMDNYSVNNYNWGAQVKIPLFLRKERGDLRINKLKLESLEYDLAFKTEQLEYKIESALNGWSNSYQKILINERVVNNYYLLLESEKVLFDIGESSLFMVNSREKAYISSRIELVEYLIENKKSELKAYYALGIISKKQPMVAIHILSNSENSANKIIDFLFENELIFEVVTMKEVTRRSKRAGTNHSAFLTIGITKALLFKQIAEEINARFIQDDPTVFSLPIVDMDPEKQKELINLTRSV